MVPFLGTPVVQMNQNIHKKDVSIYVIRVCILYNTWTAVLCVYTESISSSSTCVNVKSYILFRFVFLLRKNT